MRRLFEEPSYNYMTVRVLNSFSVLPTLHVGVCNSYRYARQVAVITENVLLLFSSQVVPVIRAVMRLRPLPTERLLRCDIEFISLLCS